MAASESELIERFFRHLGARRADVALGIGDDAALVTVPADTELVLTTDALVEGVHFEVGAGARSLGHRALAVNLSDIAAMGASPSWMLLALTMPQADEEWLREFCAGMAALARDHRVALVGGNLSRGPLTITVELAGLVPRGQALRRDGARPGDQLYVSGTLGDAAAGRARLHDPAAAALVQRFEYPQPRVALGQALRGIASACIDVSDGLYVDATRLLQASGCAAEIDLERLPLSAELSRALGAEAPLLALSGGEDYELCFCVAPAQAAAVAHAAARVDQSIRCIGVLDTGERLAGSGSGSAAGPGTARQPLRLKSSNADSVMQFSASSFDHFRH
ncbi:MAG: thiamine-phosphate kinase [Steroidobacteraceae bacterium]